MKKKYIKINNIGLFLALAIFFFMRTALMAPVHCLLMNEDYPYFRFSFGGVAYIVTAVVLSVLSAKLVFTFQEKIGEIVAVICVISLADPLFFGTKYDAIKLLVDIIVELLILNAIREKKLISTDVMLPAVLFIITFLVPFSILGYVPIMLGVYALAAASGKKMKGYGVVIIIGIVCAIAGFMLNRYFMSRFELFNGWFTSFTFVDITETTKRIWIFAAFLPIIVFSLIFFPRYKKALNSCIKKKSEKSKMLETVLDAFFYPTIISIIAVFFVESEGFCVLNIFVPAIILTLLYFKDKACIIAIEEFVHFVKEYKLIFVVAFLVIFAMALKGVDSYYPLKQLIFYIIY